MIPTYEQQLDLVRQGYAKVSVNGKLSTFKYARKVMYDNLWNKIPGILECRGHTYDNTNGKLVLLPPTKTFNYLENDTWKDVPLDTTVIAFRKFNGFMASVSVYEGEVIIGTTGTTSSNYAVTARESLNDTKYWNENNIKTWGEGCTWLFEIVHPLDPHIVKEEFGVKYLGCRVHNKGETEFQPIGSTREDRKYTLGEILTIAETVKHEGFMVYLADDMTKICKVKSTYYKVKKLLMRANDVKVRQMYNNPFSFCQVYSRYGTLDNSWCAVIMEIVRNHSFNDWLVMTDQERREVIEIILGEK